jgi:hypothetical protein
MMGAQKRVERRRMDHIGHDVIVCFYIIAAGWLLSSVRLAFFVLPIRTIQPHDSVKKEPEMVVPLVVRLLATLKMLSLLLLKTMVSKMNECCLSRLFSYV